MNVNIHNNSVSLNSSIGDELFSSTPAGAGGVTICVGADYYKFNYNWVCGNLSTGDGGGLVHLGYIYNGDIEHNSIVFNESTNPTVPTNGGGLIVMGAPPDGLTAAGLECGNTAADADCTPGLSDGTGPNLVINANLFQGNGAESGSGGGLRLQGVNGTDVVNFPRLPSRWNNVTVTNNIITNNVAGWDGAGVSLQDALRVDLINNTIASNDTTASSGVLFNTLGAPIASSQGPTCTANCGTASAPQPAGLVSVQNSAVLASTLPATITCPAGHGTGGTGLGNLNNASCRHYSVPVLYNNVFWQNRAFYIGVGALGSGTLNQQNVVALYNAFTSTPASPQPQADATAANGSGQVITGGTGACPTPVSYWDIGVRGDTGPSNHAGGILTPSYSIITDVADYSTAALHNTGSNPTFLSQYCNGSRTPPELGSMGYQVPPGISDATVPNPIFSLTPSATVDEGNNWINMSWGPLALTNPLTNTNLANYAPAAGSAVVNLVPATAVVNYAAAPSVDFFGNARKTNNAVDAGAVEFQTPAIAVLSVTPTSLGFGNVVRGTTSTAQTLTLQNTGGGTATGIGLAFSPAVFARAAAGGTCGTTLAAGTTCTINVVFSPAAATATVMGSVTITANVPVAGSPVSLTGTGVAAVSSATLTPTTWAPSQTRDCPGTGLVGIATCLADPVQTFTLTNTGNVNLTGVGTGALGGTAANTANYAIVALLTNCGNATHTTLAPGATCAVTVAFRPLTAQAAGAKPATISVTDLAGTQTSTLNGTAR